jgi:hypothetical protein
MVQVSTKAYITRLLFFSLLPVVLVASWNNYCSARFQTDLSWLILIFFISVTAIMHFSLTKIADQEPKKFVFRYMMFSGLKLFGFLMIILVYALIKRQEALGFTLLFLTMYFFFSAFEVVSFLKYFKK